MHEFLVAFLIIACGLFSGNTVSQPINQSNLQWLCIYDTCANGTQRGGIYYGGLLVVTKDNTIVENSTFTGGVIGVAVYHANNVTIRNNTFKNQSGWAIYIYDSYNSRVEGNTITDSIRSCPESPDGCESAGIMLLGVSNSYVINNHVSHAGDGIYANGEGMASNGNTFDGNVISNIPHNGLEITFSHGNKLIHNQVTNSYYPFWVGGSDITLQGNDWRATLSEARAERDSRDSTPVPTSIRRVKE